MPGSAFEKTVVYTSPVFVADRYDIAFLRFAVKLELVQIQLIIALILKNGRIVKSRSSFNQSFQK